MYGGGGSRVFTVHVHARKATKLNTLHSGLSNKKYGGTGTITHTPPNGTDYTVKLLFKKLHNSVKHMNLPNVV